MKLPLVSYQYDSEVPGDVVIVLHLRDGRTFGFRLSKGEHATEHIQEMADTCCDLIRDLYRDEITRILETRAP